MLVALRLPGVDVHEVVQVHRRYLVQLMQQWTRLKEDAADRDLGFALVVDAELFRLDSVIRWLDAADGRLKRAAVRARRTARRAAMPKAAAEGGGAAMSALELRDVSKVLRRGPTEVHALRDVDLSVDAGELVAVMGPSGSGKSTLLTIAGSLEEPTSGEVLVGGAAVSAHVAQRPGPAAAPLDRLRVPGLQPAGRAHRGRERVAAARARRRAGEDGPGRRRAGRSRSSASASGRRASPTSCPAANASGSPSPGRWSATAACCWPTSRPVRSTRSTARR